ncbi:hypothetical protein QBC46DRAFT_25558 [Diplogelasinospora grovesii]|uniref:Uncharacterized protein n=1 Tax=Diplogelasinospora grovesii TaxID=303347 RepID=A0AAN6S146_9PEZI|nr:hypothetical protein QBC46DRAFT_25558 [Diplogelasinospora grovesii]
MLGKLLLTLDAIGLLLGAPLADYNETHIFNTRWPPHAKFHGAQTITLSVILGLATLYYTWQPSFSGKQEAKTVQGKWAARQRKRDGLKTAVFTGTIYWLAGLAAVLYPGTDGVDPEFGTPGTFPQAKIFISFAGLGVLGFLVEMLLG